jgi:hypothetical protein
MRRCILLKIEKIKRLKDWKVKKIRFLEIQPG